MTDDGLILFIDNVRLLYYWENKVSWKKYPTFAGYLAAAFRAVGELVEMMASLMTQKRTDNGAQAHV